MTGSTVRRLNSVLSLQRPRSFIIVGVSLTPAEVGELREGLGPDDPPVGAVGRFRGVPIYLDGGAFPPAHDGLIHETLHGLRIVYVQMDIVD